jgi:predicted Zn-dependent protease
VAFKRSGSTEVDDAAFKVQSLRPAQADAIRADFLAYNNRFGDARHLLEEVLREEPNNVSAHETMGYLELRQRHLDEARKWYEQAVKLDSQSYLAHYYFASISMDREAEKFGSSCPTTRAWEHLLPASGGTSARAHGPRPRRCERGRSSADTRHRPHPKHWQASLPLNGQQR